MNDDTHTLRQAAARLEPDVDLLVAGATARGRRLRRRRRVAAGVAAAAAVGVVATGAATVPSLLDSEAKAPDRSGFADGTSVAPDPSPKTSPIPSEVKPDEPFQSPPPGSPDPSVRAKEMPGLVTRLFPGEVTDAAERTGQIMNGGESFQVAHFRWNGYLMSVGATSAGGGDPMARCRDNAGDGAVCERREDDSALLTWQATGPASDGGVTGRGVTLYVQGWDVFAIAYNAADGKGSPLLADEPPFTHEQLLTIVDDPSWFD
ncbi:hypothetical protein [Nocardioides sp.]|uniref:hypothetical protein n=1 Tax=Nocardioides sp. TaxID=35761 RepID=UPI001A32F3AD|nr:hypothetical protein [Nocardioides sp.]MBJ7357727.1 hypothetical protein [Nocardioides sp.]